MGRMPVTEPAQAATAGRPRRALRISRHAPCAWHCPWQYRARLGGRRFVRIQRIPPSVRCRRHVGVRIDRCLLLRDPRAIQGRRAWAFLVAWTFHAVCGVVLLLLAPDMVGLSGRDRWLGDRCCRGCAHGNIARGDRHRSGRPWTARLDPPGMTLKTRLGSWSDAVTKESGGCALER